MNIIFRHTLRSIGRSGVQAAIIVLTTVIITIMIFASFSLSDLFYDINMSVYGRTAQGADMLLGFENGGETFSRSKVSAVLSKNPEEIEYAEYFIKLPTIMKTKDVSKVVLVEATDLSDYLARKPVNYVEKYLGSSQTIPGSDITVEYYPAIVGSRFAKEAGIKVGDTVSIYLSTFDMYSKLSIIYIAADEGIFGSASSVNILTDFDAVGNMGQVNAVYIKFTDPAYFSKYQTEFTDYFGETIPSDEADGRATVEGIVRQNTTLLAVGLAFVIALMALIEISSYLVIARNRTSEMIIFKSAGATPAETAAILLAEAIFTRSSV